MGTGRGSEGTCLCPLPSQGWPRKGFLDAEGQGTRERVVAFVASGGGVGTLQNSDGFEAQLQESAFPVKVRLARFCSSSLRRLHSREAPPAVGPRGLLLAPQTRPRDRGSVPVLRPDLGFPSGAAGDPSGDTGTGGSGRGLLDAAQRPGPVAGPEKLSPGSPPEPAPLSTCLQRHSHP